MRQPAKPVFAFSKLLAALCTALFSASVLAIQPFVIRDIRVEGVQRTEAGTVFSYLPVKVGESMDDEKAAASLKALYATGFYTDVRLEVENDVLVVFVAERPAIAQIDINGAKEFTKENLKDGLKQVGISEAKIFDRSVLDRAEKEIKRQYTSRGFYSATVKTTATPLERNRVSLAFNIEEGEVSKIVDINIIGASAFSESTLLKEFETYKAFTGRKIKESRLEVLRAGFRAAWANKDYGMIISIANKLPEETLQEDEKLLTLYDLAMTRTEDGI